MSENTTPDDAPCDYCSDHVPDKGYWRCPVCDAEWPEDDDSTPPKPLPTPSIQVAE